MIPSPMPQVLIPRANIHRVLLLPRIMSSHPLASLGRNYPAVDSSIHDSTSLVPPRLSVNNMSNSHMHSTRQARCFERRRAEPPIH